MFGREQLCLLYTSDAADERSSVDLGGRRIINKKKTRKKKIRPTMTHNNVTLIHVTKRIKQYYKTDVPQQTTKYNKKM